MSGKKATAAAAGGATSSLSLEKDEVLQAVIMTDSYVKKFGPLSSNVPKCLLPLTNRPILDYTLECLKTSGVKEVFVYLTAHSQQIKDHLDEVVDTSSSSMTIVTVTNEDCRSFGDAMRDLDGKGLLRQNFILINGDTISNINLASFMEQHRLQCSVDKALTLSLILKRNKPGHSLRTGEGDLILVCNKDKRVLHYSKQSSSGVLKFPIEIFEENDDVEICYDLLDPGIAICTQAVPPLFSDNFDCQSFDEFIKEILQNDLLDNTVYYQEICEGYAARVSNLHTYYSLTIDVLNRWMFPIIPDGSKRKEYSYLRHNIYKGRNVLLKRGSTLVEDVILGANCVVEEKSSISCTAIGKDTRIGKNVILNNCIIHENVVIEDDCQLEDCVVGRGAIIHSGVKVHGNIVLGPGVEINREVELPPESFFAEKPLKDEDEFSDDETTIIDNRTAVLSSKYGPRCFQYPCSPSAWSDQHEIYDDENESESDSELSEIGETFMNEDDYNLEVFNKEVMESLSRGAEEGVKPENLILEINSSKHAYNMTLSQVNHSIVKSLLLIRCKEGFSGVKAMIIRFKTILDNYIKSPAAEKDCLSAVEQISRLHQELFLPMVTKVIHCMYEVDILSENVIIHWYKELELEDDDDDDPFTKTLHEKMTPFITWLQEADSDSDSE